MKWTLPGFFFVCAAVQTNWTWFLKLPIPINFPTFLVQISIPISPVLWRQEMLFDLVAFSAPVSDMPFQELAMTAWCPSTLLIGKDPFVILGCSFFFWHLVCDSFFDFLVCVENLHSNKSWSGKPNIFGLCPATTFDDQGKKSRKQLQRNLKPRIFGFVDLGPKRQNNQDCSAIERKINCNIL